MRPGSTMVETYALVNSTQRNNIVCYLSNLEKVSKWELWSFIIHPGKVTAIWKKSSKVVKKGTSNDLRLSRMKQSPKNSKGNVCQIPWREKNRKGQEEPTIKKNNVEAESKVDLWNVLKSQQVSRMPFLIPPANSAKVYAAEEPLLNFVNPLSISSYSKDFPRLFKRQTILSIKPLPSSSIMLSSLCNSTRRNVSSSSSTSSQSLSPSTLRDGSSHRFKHTDDASTL